MRLKMFSVFGVVLLLAGSCHHVSHAATLNTTDPISGEWDVSFLIEGMTVPAKFTFKVDGAKVTGTAFSEHTGAGTISKGAWADNKLDFTLDFAKHESIDVSGTLKDGALSGEFRTEGQVGKWTAKRKAAAASPAAGGN
jgi:hypothetical protein